MALQYRVGIFASEYFDGDFDRRTDLSAFREDLTMIVIDPIFYPIFSLIAGLVILIFPAILNYIVAIYLIVIGIMGLIAQ